MGFAPRARSHWFKVLAPNLGPYLFPDYEMVHNGYVRISDWGAMLRAYGLIFWTPAAKGISAHHEGHVSYSQHSR